MLLLALAVMTVVFNGCANDKEAANHKNVEVAKTGFPVVSEKISIDLMGIAIPTMSDWNNHSFFKRMEALTNIHMNATTIPTNAWLEKKSLAFASGDLPEVFFKANFEPQDEVSYGQQNFFQPLNDLIDHYGENLQTLFEERPEIKKAITHSDGNIYALPMISPKIETVAPNFFLNHEWIENLGLTTPQTVDELYAVLKAFKEKDPNGNGQSDEIPLTLRGINEIYKLMNYFGIPVGNEGQYVFEDDGNIRHIAQTEEFNALVLFLRKLYGEKLLDQETFTQTEQQIKSKGSGSLQLLGMFHYSGAFLAVGPENARHYSALIPFEGKNGKRVWGSRSPILRGKFAITNLNKYPEATMRWIDYMYCEEGAKLMWAGVENEDYKVNEDGTWDWILKEGETDQKLRERATIQPGGNIAGIMPEEFWLKQNNPTNMLVTKEREKLIPYSVIAYPDVYFAAEDQKKITAINIDIMNHINQYTARVITGDLEPNHEEMIKSIKQLGLDEYLSYYQKAYHQ